MRSNENLTKEVFNFFLNWLSNDSEEAGKEYEVTRTRLISFFRYRGCDDPAALADETINRVALKLPTYDLSKIISKPAFINGFAQNVYLEYLKQAKKEIQVEPEKIGLFAAPTKSAEVQNDTVDCFNNCLPTLDDSERKILIEYYSKDKGEKIEVRKELAKKLGITVNTLHVKVYRLRNDLKECIEKCVKKKSL